MNTLKLTAAFGDAGGSEATASAWKVGVSVDMSSDCPSDVLYIAGPLGAAFPKERLVVVVCDCVGPEDGGPSFVLCLKKAKLKTFGEIVLPAGLSVEFEG